ncbi:hypothetical protein ABKV19_025429 [Rosa sericea]
MTLNRLLLLPKPPPIHFHKLGLPKSTRWCSSSPSTGAQKPPNLEEQRAVATVEESDNKYVERHSGSFLNPTNFQNEVGESWLTLRGIFTNLKAKMIGTPQSQKENTVEIIDSTADKTVSEVIKTEDSPQDSEIGQPNHSMLMPKVIRDSQSCKQNISTGLRSDIVGENSSSDVLDATASNEVEVPKSLDSTGPGEAKNTIHSSADLVFSPQNMVAVTVSEVRTESVSENELTSDLLQIMRRSSLGNSAGQVASNGKRLHGGHKDVEHGINGSLVQTLEPFADSHNNEKRVTETAASNVIWKRSSKDIGQSGVKTESHRQLEVGVFGSDFDCLSSLTHKLPGEPSRILQKDIGNASTVVGNGNPQPGKRTIFDQPPTAGSDVGKMPSSSSGPQQVRGLAKMFMKTMNGQKADVITSKKSDTLASNVVLELLNETNDKTGKEDTGNRFDINGLIGCIKELPRESSTITSQNCSTPNNTGLLIKKVGSVKKVRSHANVQQSDAKRKESSLRVHAMGKETSKEDLNKIPGTSCQKEESTESKVLVRFLHKRVEESAISKAFDDCGSIMKIQLLPLIEGSNFRDGYVHFKTREGSHKALRKSELVIQGAHVVVDATSLEDVPNKISIPNLIGDPEVPLMLVKNPTRTVMIKQLTHDISSHQLKEALAFCGSGISSVFLGSSSSVAYVEFETEDAKERAIAAYSINVQEKQLLIFRIDVPRTTVIRITNIDDTAFSSKLVTGKITSICSSYGELYKQKLRGKAILDVYFKLAEWPNILSILNRLNGMEVDGDRLIAQPAPIFPPPILQVLWSKPDERIHVKSVFHRLLQNSELPVELSNLATKYHGDKYFE